MQVHLSFFHSWTPSPSLSDKGLMESPVGCLIGIPLAFLWTWMQSSVSSPLVGVHTPIVKKACPFFCTLSPIFLLLNPPFHHSCFSLFPSKLPSNKHGPTLLFFPICSCFCCIHAQVWCFQCCYWGNPDFAWYCLYGCLGTGDFARLCTPTHLCNYPIHTGILLFTIYTQ